MEVTVTEPRTYETPPFAWVSRSLQRPRFPIYGGRTSRIPSVPGNFWFPPTCMNLHYYCCPSIPIQERRTWAIVGSGSGCLPICLWFLAPESFSECITHFCINRFLLLCGRLIPQKRAYNAKSRVARVQYTQCYPTFDRIATSE